MHYIPLNVFGVYVDPFAPMMLAAWLVMLPLQSVANRLGILRYVWHPALFYIALYVIVLSLIVIGMGRL